MVDGLTQITGSPSCNTNFCIHDVLCIGYGQGQPNDSSAQLNAYPHSPSQSACEDGDQLFKSVDYGPAHEHNIAAADQNVDGIDLARAHNNAPAVTLKSLLQDQAPGNNQNPESSASALLGDR